jgi:hypothetical protein
VPVFLIVEVVAFIPSPVRPSKRTLPMHFVWQPLTDVKPPIRPAVLPCAVDLVIVEPALVDAAVLPSELADPLFLPLVVLAFVSRAIWPGLDTLSMLLVVNPVTDVGGPIYVIVCPNPISHIITPLPLVYIPIPMNQAPPPMRLVIQPLTLIHWPVLPYLNPLAMSMPLWGQLPTIDRCLELLGSKPGPDIVVSRRWLIAKGAEFIQNRLNQTVPRLKQRISRNNACLLPSAIPTKGSLNTRKSCLLLFSLTKEHTRCRISFFGKVGFGHWLKVLRSGSGRVSHFCNFVIVGEGRVLSSKNGLQMWAVGWELDFDRQPRKAWDKQCWADVRHRRAPR